MRRALPLIAVLLFATGCDGGPTEPNRTQVLTGTLARSASLTTTVSMRSTGNMRVTALDLEQVAADGTVSAAGGGVTFSTGEGDVTTCLVTGNFGLIEGSVVSLGLIKGDYCLKVTEPTQVPEGSSLRYSVELAITD